MHFLVKWLELSIEYWVIIGMSIIIVLLILLFILVFSIYKRKKFKFKINDIVSDNLLKIGKKKIINFRVKTHLLFLMKLNL